MRPWILAHFVSVLGAGQICDCPVAAATMLRQIEVQKAEQEPAKAPDSDWTKLAKAQPDYLPAGFRIVRFPAELVGWIYLAEKTEKGWRIKEDSFPYWNESSLARCRVGLAKGEVALPIDQPLWLETSAKDISFLDDIDSGTFVAISAPRAKGTLSNFRRLVETGAEHIEFPTPDPTIRSQLKQLPTGDRLKYAPRPTRSGDLASWLAKCKSLVRVESRVPLNPGWEGQIQTLHLDMATDSGPNRIHPQVLRWEHGALRIAGTMTKLRDLSVKYWSGRITETRIGPLAALEKLEAIDLVLRSKTPLDGDGVRALSKIKNLRQLQFTNISPDAYPLLKNLSVRSMSRRGQFHAVSDPELARALIGIRTLKEFPAMNVPPEALEGLKKRHDIEVLSLRPWREEVKSSAVYEEIILANPGLRRLTLGGIEVDESLRLAIAKCSKLESLTFATVKMIGDKDFVGEFPVLKTLRLSASNSGRGEAALRIRCPEVRNVKVSERWHWSTMDLLRDCPKVERLTLGSLFFDASKFDSKFVALLGGMPNLWDLNVSSIAVTPDDIPLLAKRSNLVILRLEGKLGAADLLPLRDCRMLRHLRVRTSEIPTSDDKLLKELFRGRGLRIHRELTVAEQKKLATIRASNTGREYSHVWSRKAKAGSYFDDPKVIELCKAIDKQDKARVSELLMQGVSADSRGKNGVTPLMWCMPITDTGVFELLLANGADPNVECQADFAGSRMIKGDSVTLLVARFCKAKALRAVLDHGGDPNWGLDGPRQGCLLSAIRTTGFTVEERTAKVRLLLDHGADPNAEIPGDSIFAQAIQESRLECALILLAAGADPDLDKGNLLRGLLLCHYVAAMQDDPDLSPADQARLSLLKDKLKRRKLWRPDARAEVAEVRRLEGEYRLDAVKEYIKSRWGQHDKP